MPHGPFGRLVDEVRPAPGVPGVEGTPAEAKQINDVYEALEDTYTTAEVDDKVAEAGGTQAGETDGGMIAGFVAKHPTEADTYIELFGIREDGTLTDYSIGKIEGQLIDRGNIGGGGGAVESVNGQTGAVVLDISGVNLLEPLDIWAGFSRTGGHADNEWASSTHADYIAGIDAKLAAEITAGTVVKAQIALSGTEPVYAYTYGPETAPHVLIVGGTHPNENTGGYGAMRYFTEYVLNAHPVMAAMRERVRITFVAWLGSSTYGTSRNNSNGVNLNRNFPYYWGYYDGVGQPKGAAALDQDEAAAIKTLLDTHKIGAVIDCHVGGSQDQAICWSPASAYTHTSSRHVAVAAGTLWDAVYNTGDVSHGIYGSNLGGSSTPTGSVSNYTAHYLRWHKSRMSAAAVTVECDNAEIGGAMTSSITAEGARLYCGYIHCWLVTWLTQAQTPEPLPQTSWRYEWRLDVRY